MSTGMDNSARGVKSDDILDNNFCLFLKNEIFETQWYCDLVPSWTERTFDLFTGLTDFANIFKKDLFLPALRPMI